MIIFKNKKGQDYNSFIYIWYDNLYNMYYIGSHYGSEDDGYLFGGIDIKIEYNKRPNNFIRDIISYNLVKEYSDIRKIEKEYLIKYDVENNNNFYNRTNESYGGYHKKSVENRLNDIDENGLNHFQRASIKMVKTRKENNSYKTSKIKEYNTKLSDKESFNNMKSKISNTLRGSKWVNKDNITRYIKDSEVDIFLENGWELGRYKTLSYNECSSLAKINNIRSAKEWLRFSIIQNLPRKVNLKFKNEWINWYIFLQK